MRRACSQEANRRAQDLARRTIGAMQQGGGGGVGSVLGPSRHFVAARQFRRFRAEGDIGPDFASRRLSITARPRAKQQPPGPTSNACVASAQPAGPVSIAKKRANGASAAHNPTGYQRFFRDRFSARVERGRVRPITGPPIGRHRRGRTSGLGRRKHRTPPQAQAPSSLSVWLGHPAGASAPRPNGRAGRPARAAHASEPATSKLSNEPQTSARRRP